MRRTLFSWSSLDQRQKEASILVDKLHPSHLPGLDAWPTLPLISVVVAAWNEEGHIEAFLRSFASLDYSHKELIIVAGGDDETHRLAQNRIDDQTILIEQQAGEGKFGALRKGFRHAKGSIIFLTDADCILNSESFNRIIYPIAKGAESAVTGPTRPLKHQLSNPFVRAQAANLFRKMRLVPDPHVSFLIGANCALERPLLDTCLSTPPNQPIGEDYFLALSIRKGGHKILYDHASTIETHFPSSFGAYVRQKSRWHRSYLLLHYQFDDQRWIGNALTAIRCQLLLAMPLLLFVLGYIGGLAWLLSWGIFFIPYVKAKILIEKSDQSRNTSLLALFQLMLADFSAWAISLPQLFVGRWRRGW